MRSSSLRRCAGDAATRATWAHCAATSSGGNCSVSIGSRSPSGSANCASGWPSSSRRPATDPFSVPPLPNLDAQVRVGDALARRRISPFARVAHLRAPFPDPRALCPLDGSPQAHAGSAAGRRGAGGGDRFGGRAHRRHRERTQRHRHGASRARPLRRPDRSRSRHECAAGGTEACGARAARCAPHTRARGRTRVRLCRTICRHRRKRRIRHRDREPAVGSAAPDPAAGTGTIARTLRGVPQRGLARGRADRRRVRRASPRRWTSPHSSWNDRCRSRGPGGIMSLLVPAKLWRSLAGGGVRHAHGVGARCRTRRLERGARDV